MIAELGHYALVLALGLALLQASVPMLGARENDSVLMSVGNSTALAQFAFLAIAFAAIRKSQTANGTPRHSNLERFARAC